MNDRWHLSQFKQNLQALGAKDETMRNYLLDLEQFFDWVEKFTGEAFHGQKLSEAQYFSKLPDLFEQYKDRLVRILNFSPASVNRKLSSIRKYLLWAKEAGLLKNLPEGVASEKAGQNGPTNLTESLPKSPSANPLVRVIDKFVVDPTAHLLVAAHLAKPRPQPTSKSGAALNEAFGSKNRFKNVKPEMYQKVPLMRRFLKSKYAPLAAGGLLLMTLLVLFFVQYILRQPTRLPGRAQQQQGTPVPTGTTQTTPQQTTAPSTAKRFLTFQGRLTDSSGAPITSTSAVTFKLYNSSVAGSPLWEEGNTVTPDQNGTFSLVLGTSTDLPASLFVENEQVFLGLAIESGPELSPRQQVPNFDLARNALMLQGKVPSVEGTANSIPVIDSTGNLSLASESATVTATNGTLTLQGKTVTLQTIVGSGGDIVLSPDAGGFIDIQGPLTNTTESGTVQPGAVEIQDELVVIASGSATALRIIQSGTGDVFQVGSLTVKSSGDIGIGTTTPTGKLEVTDTSGNLLVLSASSSAVLKADVSGNLQIEGKLSDISGATLTIDDALEVLGTTITLGNGLAGTIMTTNNKLTLDSGTYNVIGFGNDDSLIPGSGTTNLGSPTDRWDNIYGGNGDFSGNMTIGGTLTVAGGLGCTDCLDFDDFEDTMDLDANLTLNQTTNSWAQTYTGTSGTGFTYTAGSLTTGAAVDINATNTATTATALQQVRFDLVNAQATLANTDFVGVGINFTNSPTVAGNTEYAFRIQNQLTGNTTDNAVAGLLVLDNADSSAGGSTVITDALRITNSGDIAGGIVNAINIDDTDITTDIVLQNDETIDNNTDGTVNIGTTILLLTGGTTLNTNQTTFNLVNTTATTVNFAGAAATLNIAPTGASGSIALSGGSADTGCTLDGTTGNFTCSGNITGSSSGTVGFWTRTGTTLSPATANDVVAITSNDTTNALLSLTSTGISTSSNVLAITQSNASSTGTSLQVTNSGTGDLLGLTASGTGTTANGILITQSSTGTITDAIDVSDEIITNALNVGANTITGTGFSITTTSGDLTLDTTGGSILIGSGDEILATGANSDIGSSGTRFATGWFDTIDATNLAGTVVGGSTTSSSWTINSDNATADTEDSSLAFERGTTTPNAVLLWDSTNDEFDLNGGLHLSDTIVPVSTNLLALDATGTGTTANGLIISQTSTGVITDAIDVSDETITNALNVGANTITGAGYLITSTGSGLTINSTSADLSLTTTTSGNITQTTALATGLVNILTGNLKVGNGTPGLTQDGEDAYIEGTLEVDGNTQLDGNLTVNGTTVTATNVTTFNCTDCLDFDDFEDTLDVDAALIVNQGTNTWTQNFTGTTTNGFTLNATSLTSGKALVIAGSTTTGVESALVSISGDAGGGGASLVNIAPDLNPTLGSSAGVQILTTNATTITAQSYSFYNGYTLSGNAAKDAIGIYNTVSSSSTTADTLTALFSTTAVTGIMTTGTRNAYGLYSNPTAGAESTGGTTNVYGVYSLPSADVAAGGTVNSYGLYVANGTYDTDGTSRAIGAYLEPVTGADTNIGLCFDCDGTFGTSTVATGIQYGTDANAVQLYRSANDTLMVQGSTSAGTILSVGTNGDGKISVGIVDPYLILNTNTSTRTLTLRTTASASADDIVFDPAGTERMRLNEAGQLQVSATGSTAGILLGGDANLYRSSADTLATDDNFSVGGNLTFSGAGTLNCTDCIDFDDIIDSATLDASFAVTQGTNTVTFSNSNTTQTSFTLSGSSYTTGEILDLTGTWAPTDGSTNEAIDINLTHSPTTLPDNFRGVDVNVSDSTALANTIFGYEGLMTLSGNAAKTGVGLESEVTSSSTTADDIRALQALTSVSGIMTTGTRNVYGLLSAPSAGAESTGGTTNVYGVRTNVTADVGVGGTLNGYGLYVANGTFDTDGTSTQYGLFVESVTGADTNYAAAFTGGNVGVGTATPTQLLDLVKTSAGATTIPLVLANSSATTDTASRLLFDLNGSHDGFSAGITATRTNDPASQASALYFSTCAGTCTSSSNLAERMRIDPSGNVGINDTSPDAKLEILATSEQLRLTHTDGTQDARFSVSSTGDLTITQTGTGTTEQLVLADTQVFNVGGSGSTDVAYNVIGDSTAGADASLNSDDDLLIEGNLQVGGTIIGGATFNCTDCLDFDDFEDTLDVDAALIVNQGTNTWTQNFTGDTTVGLTYNANSLTTGTAVAIGSNATSFNGELLTLTKSGASGATAFTSDIANITYTQTFNAAPGDSTGNVLDTSRVITIDDGTAGAISGTVSGALARLADNCVAGTADTCTSTADVLAIIQNFASNSGAALNVTSAGTGLVARFNDDGTLTDSTPVVVDASGNVGIGDTSPDALLDLDSTDTDGGDFLITNTGVGTSGSVFTITSNSTTTGDIATINATALTTGTALTLTGPSSTGVTDDFVKVSADVGSGAALVKLNPDFSGAGVTASGIYVAGTDSTASTNSDLNIRSVLTLTGNAAKSGYGFHGTVDSSSTTADTLYGEYLTSTVTGIITTGTRNVYGLYSEPTAGAESTGGTTNVYSLYAKPTADVAAGGTVNAYGYYFANGTYDTDGTSRAIGAYFEPVAGADTNIGLCFDCDGTFGTSSVATGIQYGTDANAVQLYRSAADTLMVQGSTSAATVLTVGTNGDGKINVGIVDPWLILNTNTTTRTLTLRTTASASADDIVFDPASVEKMRLVEAGQLQLPTTGSTGGLLIGGDTTLYRSAVDTLATDDNVSIGGNLTFTGAGTISCTDCIDFDDITDSATLDASTAIGFGASTFNLTFTNNGSGNEIHNLSSTGDFVIQDGGTPFATFSDAGLTSLVGDVDIGDAATDTLSLTSVVDTNLTFIKEVARTVQIADTTTADTVGAALTIKGAAGGNTVAGTAGIGGAINLTAGAGGISTGAGNKASGGALVLTGGAGGGSGSGVNSGGAVSLVGGGSGDIGGAVNITGGTTHATSSNVGGAVVITGGAAGSSGTGAGGAITLTSGAGGGSAGNSGDITINSGSVTSGTIGTINIATANTPTVNLGDGTQTITIDIGGVTSSNATTLNLATNSTAADTIAIGNSNASTTLAITGGDDWNIAANGTFTFTNATSSNNIINLSSTGDFVIQDNGTDVFTFSDTGTLTIDPTTSATTVLDFELATQWLSGTLIRADYGSATSLTGSSDVIGMEINFNTNVTPDPGKVIRNIQLRTPVLTQTTTGTSSYGGLVLSTPGALTQNTAAGTINWVGAELNMPAITQTTGTITANGVYVANGSITTGGTEHMINLDATGVGAGTLNGLRIGNITGGAGTETAISVGSGFDTDIAFVDSSVILDGPASSTLTFQDFVTITAASLTDFDCTDCIDGDDLADSIALDANTAIVQDGTETLTLSNTGSGNTIVNLTSTGDFVIQDNGTTVFTFSDTGTLTVDPTSTGTITDYELATQWTTGTLINADYGGATTLTGNITALNVDFKTNVTPGAGRTIRGFNFDTPVLTQTTADTSNYAGFVTNPGALTQNTAAGTIEWWATSIQLPNITQTTGTINTYGVQVANGSITTGGLQYLVDLVGTGVGAGTLRGVNIRNITSPGAGTETALFIGSGWDTDINATTDLELGIDGTDELTLTATALAPSSDGGNALGTTTLGWNGLHLNTGTAINWENSDVTLTHASDDLDIDGGNLTFNEAGGDFDFRIESDTNANHFVSDAGVFGGVGAFGFGTALSANLAYIIVDPPAFTAAANTNIARMRLANAAAITIPAGTTSLVTSLHVEEPNITATGTVTQAASLYIEEGPTEGGVNYALFVDAGTSRFDGDIIGTDGTSTVNLITATAGSSTVFNETGADIDFRIEGDTLPNLFVVDAGNDRIGINDATPDATLDFDAVNVLTNVFGITATSLQTGEIMDLTATYAPTDGSTNEAIDINLTHTPTTLADTFQGINLAISDGTALANTLYPIFSDLTLTGNAAKDAYGIYSRVNTSSTTGDSIRGGYFTTTQTGILASGTKTVIGVQTAPASTAANTAGTTNLYGTYDAPSLTGPTTGTTTTSNVYGNYITTTGTHAADAGTVNQYGLYLANGTSSTNGTSAKYGMYLEPQTGADTNVGICFDCDGTFGTSTVASGIQYGTDANRLQLYRSAADTLMVQGSTSLATVLTVGTNGDGKINVGIVDPWLILNTSAANPTLTLETTATAGVDDIVFEGAGTERVRFAEGGNVTLTGGTTITASSLTTFTTAASFSMGSTTSFSCADCIDFDDMEDTLDIDADLIVNQGTSSWTQNFTGTTSTGFVFRADSVSSGTAMAFSFDGLTTGIGYNFDSGSTVFTSADLIQGKHLATYTTAQTVSGNVLDLSRDLTINAAATVLTINSPMVTLTDNCTQTAGTCTHSGDVLRVTQDFASSTGVGLNVDYGGADAGFAVRFNDDGTTADTSAFVVNGTGQVGINEDTPIASAELTVAGDIIQSDGAGATINSLSASGSFNTVFNEQGSDIDFRIEADANAAAFAIDAGSLSGVGEVLMGTSTPTSASYLHINPPAITATANSEFRRVHIANTNAITVPTGTSALVTSLYIAEPNITATGTVTASSTLYVASAPTEATTNYALWVDAGATQLDGTLAVVGDTTLTGDLAVNGGDLTSTATTFNLLNTTVTTLNIGGASNANNLAASATAPVLTIGGSSSTSTTIQMNALGASGFALIDLAVEGGTADYDARIIRATGANGNLTIDNRGTGVINLRPNLVSSLQLSTTATVFNEDSADVDFRIESDGNANMFNIDAGTDTAGIGAAASGTGTLAVGRTWTNPAAERDNLQASITFSETSAANATNPHNIDAAIFVAAANTQNWTNRLTNMRTYLDLNSTANAYTISNYDGYRVENAVNLGSATITNQYGLFVSPLTSGTSDYGARIDAADTQTLWLSGNADNTTAAAGIAFGSSRDTNLYRSAADTLRTDDSFTLAGGTLTFVNGGTITTSGASTDDLTIDPADDLNLGTGAADDIFLGRTDVNITTTINGLMNFTAIAGATTAITITDTDFTNALSLGDNNITGTTANIDLTNFDVVGSTGDTTLTGDLAVNGGDITTTATTATLFNATATTLSLGGAATTALNIGTGSSGYAAINIGTGGGSNSINIATGAGADTINIGTGGTSADTINIGNTTTSTSIALSAGTGGVAANSQVVSGNAYSLTASALTTGTALQVNVDAITTGQAFAFEQDNRDMLALTDRDFTVGGHTDAITQSGMVATFVYDTSKDTDGGRWTDDERSKSSSWYTETIDAAAAACAPASNDRCGDRRFPKKALIVVTGSNVYIYDAKDNTMWLRFDQGTDFALGVDASNDPSSVWALNGRLFVGTNGLSATGMYMIDFINDRITRFNTTDAREFADNIDGRNADPGTDYPDQDRNALAIVHSATNDVHVQVVNGKLYAAIANDAGVSVIQITDQVTYSYSDVTGDDYNNAWIDKRGDLWALNEALSQLERWDTVFDDSASELNGTPDNTWDETTTPALATAAPTINAAPDALYVMDSTSIVDGKSPAVYVGHNVGLTVINTKIGDQTNGSVKYYDVDRITEEMVGDIRNMMPFAGSLATANTTLSAPDTDTSVKLNNWTNSGGTNIPAHQTAVRGQGMDFDGTDDYVCTGTTGTCADDADLDSGGTVWSFGGWFKRDADDGSVDTIAAKWGNASADQAYRMYINSADDVIHCQTNTSSTVTSASAAAYTDTTLWHHAVCTYDGSNQRLYVDGVLVDTDAQTGSITNSGVAATVGADLSGASNAAADFFNGDLDESFVTAETLSAGQIKHIYQIGPRALQNRNSADSDDDGSSDFDTLQQLEDFSSSGSNVSSVAVDESNSYIYAGTRETSDGADNGAVSVIGLNSDSRVKAYIRNSILLDDDGSLLGNGDILSLSVSGKVQPDTSCTTSNCSTSQLGGNILIGTDGDFWAESKDVTFQDFLANNYNPFGTSLNQSNLVVDSLFSIMSQISSKLDNLGDATDAAADSEPFLYEAFRVDGYGNFLSRSLINSTTAMQFQNAAGTTVLDIDTTNGFVGIGTTSPDTKLDVEGTSGETQLKIQSTGSGTHSSLLIDANTGSIPYIRSSAGGSNLFEQGYSSSGYYFNPTAGAGATGAALFIEDATSEVGIGDTSPDGILDVETATTTTAGLFTNANSSATGSVLQIISTAAQTPVEFFANTSTYTGRIKGDSSGNMVLGSGAGAVSFRTGETDIAEGSEKMTILNGGNVGIADVSPEQALNIRGNIQLGDDDVASPYWLGIISAGADQTGGVRYGTEASPASKWSIYGSSNDSNLHINMGATERVTIDSAGNVGIGITTPSGVLDVRGTVGDTGLDIPGVRLQPTLPSTATTAMSTLYVQGTGGTGTYTTTSVYGIQVADFSKGASQTITSNYGLKINARTVGGTNNYGLYVDAPSGGSGVNLGILNAGMSRFADAVGVGNAPSDAVALSVRGTSTTGATQTGLQVNEVFSTAATTAGRAIYAAVENTGVFTMANAYGLYVDNATLGGSTITTNYGINVVAQTAGGTSDYGVAIGAADTQTLWLSSNADNTTAAAGIAFGSSRDTNLYRSAANRLATDDSFNVLGTNTTVGRAPTGNDTSYGLVVQGALCVDDATANCPATPTAGNIELEGALNNFDVAETYSSSEPVEPGDVLIIDQSDIKTVKKSGGTYETTVIGIVSEDPAISFEEGNIEIGGGEQTPLKPLVALIGRVPAKVSTENGPINIGDALTTSSIPGVAMRASKGGPTVGKALESFNGSGYGKVMTFVNVSWYDPDVQLASTQQFLLEETGASTILNPSFQVRNSAGQIISRIGAFSELVVGNVKAGFISAQKVTTQQLTSVTANISQLTASTANIQKLTTDKIVSPIAEFDIVSINVIAPIDPNSDIAARFEDGNFEIVNTDSPTPEPVVTIDNEGNVHTEGDLSARSADFSGEVTADGLTAGEATISGTLRAGTIIADNIEGLNAKISTLSAGQITNITNVTNVTQVVEPEPALTDEEAASASAELAETDLGSDLLDIASFSAQLAYVSDLNTVNLKTETFEAQTATFTQGLMSLGLASFADVSVAQTLTIGSNFILTEGSINVLGADLMFQNLRQGGISFMDGLVYIDTDGNLKVEGNLAVSGDVTVDGKISTDTIQSSDFAIQNASGSAVLSLSGEGNLLASGSGTFRNIALLPDPSASPSAALDGSEIVTNTSAGSATLSAGTTQLIIRTPLIKESSLIYVTPTSSTQNKTLYVKTKAAADPADPQGLGYFVVGVDTPVTAPIIFNYWIIDLIGQSESQPNP